MVQTTSSSDELDVDPEEEEEEEEDKEEDESVGSPELCNDEVEESDDSKRPSANIL